MKSKPWRRFEQAMDQLARWLRDLVAKPEPEPVPVPVRVPAR